MILEINVSYNRDMTTRSTARDSGPAVRGRGRPRQFDMDEALDKAMRLFSERGYHATSIGELSAAMGLASGSVYKAFKDKRAVFMAAFEHYRRVRSAKLAAAIDTGQPARQQLAAVLRFYAESSCGAEGRRGCLVAGSAAELATFDAEMAQQVSAALRHNEQLILGLIRQGQTDGSIGSAVDAGATARMLLCLLQGMRIVGKSGRSRAEMGALLAPALKLLD
jgi:TetR/AcrR family transcriptional regulator, transcriptional repressor for nem operon